ncbi:unnamed protein product [Parnassius apollo]|uniref:(apollo) hypothetical protein n=2 Tax=Parnassius apollo TaxID=110799 RepID=A0A8S3XRF7_PARAO|nr:unnamed protein product [Parnassius apollo]
MHLAAVTEHNDTEALAHAVLYLILPRNIYYQYSATMTIDFYHMIGSPPCSLVEMTFVALGLESQVKHHFVDFLANEQFTPEYLKMNPQHTAPTIVDDGFVLWESRAISKYLVDKYSKGNALYPVDVQARAVVDQRLDFDLDTLYGRFTEYYFKYFFEGKPLEESGLKKIQEALGFLDTFLANTKYVAGSELTLADLALFVTVSFIEAGNISVKEYPNIVRWYDLVKSTAPKLAAINDKHLKDFIDFFDGLAKK